MYSRHVPETFLEITTWYSSTRTTKATLFTQQRRRDLIDVCSPSTWNTKNVHNIITCEHSEGRRKYPRRPSIVANRRTVRDRWLIGVLQSNCETCALTEKCTRAEMPQSLAFLSRAPGANREICQAFWLGFEHCAALMYANVVGLLWQAFQSSRGR